MEPFRSSQKGKTQVFYQESFKQMSTPHKVTFLSKEENQLALRRHTSQDNHHANEHVSPLIDTEKEEMLFKGITMVTTSCGINEEIQSVFSSQNIRQGVEATNSERMTNAQHRMLPKITATSLIGPASRTIESLEEKNSKNMQTSFETLAKSSPKVIFNNSQFYQQNSKTKNRSKKEDKDSNNSTNAKRRPFMQGKSTLIAKKSVFGSISSQTDKLNLQGLSQHTPIYENRTI